MKYELTEELRQELLNKKVETIEVGVFKKVRIVAEKRGYVLCIIDSRLERGFPFNLEAFAVWSRGVNGGFCGGYYCSNIDSAWQNFNERANR